MIFIDEKGRVFGKINIIDLIAAIILVCIITAIIKFSSIELSEDKYLEARVDLEIQDSHQCFIDSVKKGDVEFYNDNLVGTVESITNTTENENQSPKNSNKDLNNIKNAKIVMILNVKQKNGKIYYTEDQMIELHKLILIKLKNVHFAGKITHFEIIKNLN